MISKKKLFWDNPDTIRNVKNSLKNDEICITSTDTILGLLGNLTEKSFNAINEIKGKRNHKPYLILISDKTKLSNFINTNTLNEKILKIINTCWPGPLTIIFKAKKNLTKFLISKENTIALRCPKHMGLQRLLTYFDGLFSTSANTTNTPPPIQPENIDPQILKKISYLVIDSKKDLKQTLPSTIIDISDDKEVKVIREGTYSIKEIEEYYGS
jgi:L-threonylcarbamoyladenylate synthase